MKKIYVIILMSLMVTMAKATIHQVQVLSGSFNPSTVNAVVGDTVGWIWTGGSHTTTSTTIPGCGIPWDNPIDASNMVFGIVVPCAGTYNYKCTPHNFTGVIIVTNPSAVPDVAADNVTPMVYPNPSANGIFNITFGKDQSMAKRVYVVNTDGKKIVEKPQVTGATNDIINLQAYAEGIYFLVIENENGKKVAKLVR